ncbi:Zn-dependent amino-or carboxypeptidase, M28 family [Nonomuraea pusilla]|uniref:Zn-dependent amino-or carboxypeptidase, M28 family n=2 Tax=Nonomuraea pusilla TaxID=46177 RepID=A0A1H7I729_9ACTN|nr:Zn-dependent amino-or carboxypeptidase, M28 family [Nonomuraea pusilla]
MDEAASVPVAPARNRSRGYPIPAMAAWLLASLAALLSVLQIVPPDPVPAQAGPGEFSSARAMEHLKQIAVEPRPTGSPRAAAVRDLLVRTLTSAGFTAQVQVTTVVRGQAPGMFTGARVENVVARLRGMQQGPAVLLSAHYDSVPAGPGANDDGVAVAALLETARALKAGPPLRNDVIILLSDGEERGLLGAQAFVDQHPWARSVGMALNFEARGGGGPSIMFETGRGNGLLIKGLAQAPDPVATSLATAVYRTLPNDTDFSIFRQADIPGLNFAYVGEHAYYHNAADTLENVEPATVQHQGDYALTLARHFGMADLNAVRAPDVSFFTLPGLGLVSYQNGLVLPLGGLALLLLAAAVTVGVRRRRLSGKGLRTSLLFLLAGTASSALVPAALWWGITVIRPDHQVIVYDDVWYGTALLLAAAGTALLWLRAAIRRAGSDHLLAGVGLVWALPLAVALALAPEGAYLLTWPLLLYAGALLYLYARPDRSPAALVPAAVAAAVLFAPVLYLLHLTLGIALIWVVAIGLTLVLWMMSAFAGQSRKHRWSLLVVAAVALLILAGDLTSGFTAREPRPATLLYGLDADTGTARWISPDPVLQPWQEKLLPDSHSGPMPVFFQNPMSLRTGQAPVVPALTPPQVEVLADTVAADGTRTVRLRARSTRGAAMLQLVNDSPVRLLGLSVDGTAAAAPAPTQRWSLTFFAPAATGIEVTLRLSGAEQPVIRLRDRSFGLAEIPFQVGRPGATVPGTDDGDFVVVSRRVPLS